MRKSLLLLATLLPLAGLLGVAGLALPAAAESEDDACIAGPALDAGPLNLDAIPAKPVGGLLSVRGAGDDDDCDQGRLAGIAGHHGDDEGADRGSDDD